jgi:hypothetical protein
MKHILNNLTEEEKKSIREQHTGGIKIVNENFSKLIKATLGDSKPLVSEQYYPTAEERYSKAGYKEVMKINLPDGTYIGNPDGSATINSQENLNSVGDIHIYNNNQRTGYVINFNRPSRSGYKNVEINIRGGNQDTFEGKVYYKDVRYKPSDDSDIKNKETLTNKVATEGIKNVTTQMISSPPFKGMYSGYQFGGEFNGTNYQWNCNGVEGMSGVRGMVDGKITSALVEEMIRGSGKSITDAKPKSVSVGFYSDNIKFIIYTTTSNKTKCVNY